MEGKLTVDAEAADPDVSARWVQFMVFTPLKPQQSHLGSFGKPHKD